MINRKILKEIETIELSARAIVSACEKIRQANEPKIKHQSKTKSPLLQEIINKALFT